MNFALRFWKIDFLSRIHHTQISQNTFCFISVSTGNMLQIVQCWIHYVILNTFYATGEPEVKLIQYIMAKCQLCWFAAPRVLPLCMLVHWNDLLRRLNRTIIMSLVLPVYFSQNTSRVCVLVCPDLRPFLAQSMPSCNLLNSVFRSCQERYHTEVETKPTDMRKKKYTQIDRFTVTEKEVNIATFCGLLIKRMTLLK